MKLSLIFFIQDSTGIGKTFLYSVLYHHYWAYKKIVLCVTFFGIASLFLPGNYTSHSQHQILLNLYESS